MRAISRLLVASLTGAVLLGFSAAVATAADTKDTITLKLYPRTAREQVWGVIVPWGEPETVRIENYRIFDLRGDPKNHILLETAGGMTRLAFEDIRRIDFLSYPRVYHYNSRVESIRYVVRANLFLTDGSRIENAVVNAHWGLVDGDTELGRFYLRNPLTVASITFDAH